AGHIAISGASQVTFLDDVVNNGAISISSGNTAVFFGSFSGANGTTGAGSVLLEGDLRPGNSPAAISFGGDVSFGSGAALDIELGGLSAGSQYDTVHIA